jgi:hypothetical protein
MADQHRVFVPSSQIVNTDYPIQSYASASLANSRYNRINRRLRLKMKENGAIYLTEETETKEDDHDSAKPNESVELPKALMGSVN